MLYFINNINKLRIQIKLHYVLLRNMAGMRDKLIHDYMGINYSIVWDVVKNKIPLLYPQVLEIIETN